MIFTSDELVSKVVSLLPRCPRVKYVVFFSNGVIQKHIGRNIDDLDRFNDTARKSVEAARASLPDGVQLFDILQLEKQGKVIVRQSAGTNSEPLLNWVPPAAERPKPNDLAVIMYTSGSTGAWIVDFVYYSI